MECLSEWVWPREGTFEGEPRRDSGGGLLKEGNF